MGERRTLNPNVAGSSPTSSVISGRGEVRLSHLIWDQGNVSSNLTAQDHVGCSSMIERLIVAQVVTGLSPVSQPNAGVAQLVEHYLAMVETAGSTPASRSWVLAPFFCPDW